jgi:hypothetical protein
MVSNDYSNYNAFTNSINITIWLYLLNAIHPDVLFDSQGIIIIQSNTIFIVKIHLYTRLHVSAPWSHHQASTVEQIQIWFCTIWIPTVYSAEIYCLRCIVNLKLLELKCISVYCNKLKYCIFTILLKCQVQFLLLHI